MENTLDNMRKVMLEAYSILEMNEERKHMVTFNTDMKADTLNLAGGVYISLVDIPVPSTARGKTAPGFEVGFARMVPATREEPEDVDIIPTLETRNVFDAAREAIILHRKNETDGAMEHVAWMFDTPEFNKVEEM